MSCRALMRWLLVVAALSLGTPTLAGPAQGKQQAPPKKAKKVWTNDDLDALRAKSRISVVGEEPPPPKEAGEAGAGAAGEAGGEGAAKAGGEKAATEPYVKEKDPKYYRQRLTPLRAEIERIESDIRRVREFRTSANTGQAGLTLGRDSSGLSPEDQIDRLEKRRAEVQRQIDGIEDEARRNGIPLGLLR